MWLAEDSLRGGQLVALKELAVATPERARELRQEFATLASLHHPNLVAVHEFGVTDGRPHFTLEYVEGDDLVTASRGATDAEVTRLTVECLRALSFLHDFGLVHRDLKPANILVRRTPRNESRVVLLDFGLAQQRTTLGNSPGLAGTLPYLAPELIRGTLPGRRSDLFGLGAILFEIRTGSVPFDADPENPSEYLRAVQEGRRRPSRGAGPFDDWIEELLDADPARRPADAEEAAARLNRISDSEVSVEVPATRAARLASGTPPGRDELLQAIWADLRQVGPKLIWLCGEAGTGKSRILRSLSSEASRLGWRVHLGLDGIESDGTKDVLVLLDDVDGAGTRAAEFIEKLSSSSAGSIRAVIAVRPNEIGLEATRNLLQGVAWLPNSVRHDLLPFTRDEVNAVATRALRHSVTDEMATEIHLATEGLPLLVEAMLVDGRPATAQNPSLEGSVAARVNQLTEAARAWMNALSVAGGASSAERCARVVGLSDDEGRIAAESLERLSLVRRCSGTLYEFASQVVRDIVYARLDEVFRKTLATRSAELAAADGATADELRLLYAAAGKTELAIEQNLLAATNCEQLEDWLGAADRVRTALCLMGRRHPNRCQLWARHAAILDRTDSPLAAARAWANAARLQSDSGLALEWRARQTLGVATGRRATAGIALADRVLADAKESAVPRAIAMTARALSLTHLGQVKDAIACGEQAVQSSSSDLPENEGLALAILGSALMFDRQYDRSLAAFSLARERCTTAINRAKSQLGVAIVTFRHVGATASLECFREALAMARDAKLVGVQSSAMSNYSLALADEGRIEEAMRVLEQAELIAVHSWNPSMLVNCRLQRADLLVEFGRAARAVELFPPLESIPQTHVEKAPYRYIELTRIEALLELVPLPRDELAGRMERLYEIPGFTGRQRVGTCLLDLHWQSLQADGGNSDEAWRRYVALREGEGILVEDHHLRALVFRAKSLLSSGRLGDSREIARSAIDASERAGQPAVAARAYGVLAEIHAAEGRTNAARRAHELGRAALDQAANKIKDPELRQDFLARGVFATLRKPIDELIPDDAERLLAIYGMIKELNSETDVDRLLESTLDMAVRVVKAERGMVLLRDRPGGEFVVRLARNLDRQTIDDAAQFSRNVVKEAGAGRAVLSIDAAGDERLRSFKSVSIFGIRSVLCVPLKSRGKIIGAVYLDNREAGGLLKEEDLPFLEAFADHAALALENAQIRSGLERTNQRLQVAARERVEFANMIGKSPGMQRVFDLIPKVAESRAPVLIHGESGTGKELVARAIHAHGPRKQKTFLSENCAAIPESLLESELFGHVKGAFTGADRERAGLFEQADGGTLFLDEVGDMSPAMQARLLRVLQEGEVRRVGGDRPIHVDVRMLAASHRDLPTEVAEGRFREDLMYRLQVLVVDLPPLRDRPGDVRLLVAHMLAKISEERGRPLPPIDRKVMDVLERYSWPGNVRQLEGHLQRLALLATDDGITTATIEADDGLRKTLLGDRPKEAPVFSLDHHEREQIRAALDRVGGNRTQAAKLLGISRATIFRRIKEFGL